MHISSRASDSSSDRRRAARVEVLDHLHGFSVAMKVPIVVREASSSGFSIESPVPFPAGSRHEFRFTTAEGQQVVVEAQSVHTMRVNHPDARPLYVTGFEFDHAERAQVRVIQDLVEKLLDVPTH